LALKYLRTKKNVAGQVSARLLKRMTYLAKDVGSITQTVPKKKKQTGHENMVR